MIGLRASPELRTAIEKWAGQHIDAPSLSEAIRRLVELGLAHAAPTGQLSAASRSEASTLASNTIDRLTDETATAEEQEKRKRRLIKGPLEFREMRKDQTGGHGGARAKRRPARKGR